MSIFTTYMQKLHTHTDRGITVQYLHGCVSPKSEYCMKRINLLKYKRCMPNSKAGGHFKVPIFKLNFSHFVKGVWCIKI
jgi:hypothetical protein